MEKALQSIQAGSVWVVAALCAATCLLAHAYTPTNVSSPHFDSGEGALLDWLLRMCSVTPAGAYSGWWTYKGFRSVFQCRQL